MIHQLRSYGTQRPQTVLWFMVAAWVLILGKCALVVWAMDHWHVPFHPAWIVAPTLSFAALATALLLAREGE